MMPGQKMRELVWFWWLLYNTLLVIGMRDATSRLANPRQRIFCLVSPWLLLTSRPGFILFSTPRVLVEHGFARQHAKRRATLTNNKWTNYEFEQNSAISRMNKYLRTLLFLFPVARYFIHVAASSKFLSFSLGVDSYIDFHILWFVAQTVDTEPISLVSSKGFVSS
jgi:hypothetical protein